MSEYFLEAPSEKELKKLHQSVRINIKNLFHEDASVRASSARALGKTKHSDAVPYLIRAIPLWGPSEETNEIISALGEIGDRRVVSILEQQLTYGFYPINRLNLLNALLKIGGPNKVPAVTGLLNDGQKELREAAENALVAYYHPTVVNCLVKELSSKDEEHQKKISRMLEKISEKALEEKRTPTLAHVCLQTTLTLINPLEYPNAFKTFYFDLLQNKIRHLKKNSLKAYAGQLKASDEKLKA